MPSSRLTRSRASAKGQAFASLATAFRSAVMSVMFPVLRFALARGGAPAAATGSHWRPLADRAIYAVNPAVRQVCLPGMQQQHSPARRVLRASNWRLVAHPVYRYIRVMESRSSDGLGLITVTIPELHAAPVFYPAGTRLIWISEAGEIAAIDRQTASARLARNVPLVCHRRWSEARAGQEIETCLDVMELYAFVRPARFCLPTPRGLAAQLALPRPVGGEDMAALLPRAAYTLLDEMAATPAAQRREAGAIATMMAASGWPWGPIILAHLGLTMPPAAPPDGRQAAIWHRLPEYTDFTASPPPGTAPVMADAARQRLASMLGTGAEPRQSQSDYAAALAAGFDTPEAGPTPARRLAIWHRRHCGPRRTPRRSGFRPIPARCSTRSRRS
jgi:hypothetical protein